MGFSRNQYSKIYVNANSLIDSGIKIAAELNNYGAAISLLILGLEELVKYQVVLSNSGEETAFSEKTFNKVFRHHETKHSLLQDLAISVTKDFRDSFLVYVLKVASNQELDEKDKIVQENGFKELGNMFGLTFENEGYNEDEINKFINWLKNADNLKKRGFYVDYSNNIFHSPNELKQSDYDEALSYVCFVQKHSQYANDLDFSQDEFLNFLNTDIPK